MFRHAPLKPTENRAPFHAVSTEMEGRTPTDRVADVLFAVGILLSLVSSALAFFCEFWVVQLMLSIAVGGFVTWGLFSFYVLDAPPAWSNKIGSVSATVACVLALLTFVAVLVVAGRQLKITSSQLEDQKTATLTAQNQNEILQATLEQQRKSSVEFYAQQSLNFLHSLRPPPKVGKVPFIQRPEFEEYSRLLEVAGTFRYVTGPSGCGKTFCLQRACTGKENVVYINASRSLEEAVSAAFGFGVETEVALEWRKVFAVAKRVSNSIAGHLRVVVDNVHSCCQGSRCTPDMTDLLLWLRELTIEARAAAVMLASDDVHETIGSLRGFSSRPPGRFVIGYVQPGCLRAVLQNASLWDNMTSLLYPNVANLNEYLSSPSSDLMADAEYSFYTLWDILNVEQRAFVVVLFGSLKQPLQNFSCEELGQWMPVCIPLIHVLERNNVVFKWTPILFTIHRPLIFHSYRTVLRNSCGRVVALCAAWKVAYVANETFLASTFNATYSQAGTFSVCCCNVKIRFLEGPPTADRGFPSGNPRIRPR